MVSALPICLLLVAGSVVSSQLLSDDSETLISDRRTFKHHRKPIKYFPLIKKHKKFGGWLPHVFGKTQYTEIPVIQEAPVKPLYKFHRYQGIEVKPVSDIHTSVSGPIIESQPEVHSSDFESTFTSDHSAPLSSSGYFYEKPAFSDSSLHSHPPVFPAHPAPPTFTPIPSPQPIFQFIPTLPPSPPTLPSIPITFQQAPIHTAPAPAPVPVFQQIPIARPAPAHIAHIPAISNPAPPVLAPLPAPLPSFALSTVPSPPILPSITFKIPAPAPAPLPLPALPPISLPIFSFPRPSPAPVIPSLPIFPSPAPSPALPASPAPEPEYPYPPSGTPIPSYIKDISLPEVTVTEPTPANVVTPNYEEVSVTVDDSSKHFDHGLVPPQADAGLFQKLKGWKAEKANAALNHLSFFKKPAVISQPTISVSTLPPPQVASYPTIQFPVPVHPLPLTPDFKPATVFFPHNKYENFPPNQIQPQLFNSYGAPVSHDSFHSSVHDRLSGDASEEEPSVVPPPSNFGEKKSEPKQQNDVALQQQQQQQGFSTQNVQPQTQSQIILPQEQPIYVPENSEISKEANSKAADDSQQNRNGQENQPQGENSNLENHRTTNE